MQKLNIIFSITFAFIFLISFSSAELQVGLDGPSDGVGINFLPPEQINISIVNASDYWNTDLGLLDNPNSTQFENNGGTLNILNSWLTSFGNSLWCRLTGCTMEGNIDMDGNDILGINNLNITNNLTVSGNTKIDKYLHLNPSANQFLANEFSDDGAIFVGGDAFFNKGASLQSRQYGYGLMVQDYNIPGVINRTSTTGEFNGTTQYLCDYTTGFTQTDIDKNRAVVFGHDALYPLVSDLKLLINSNCVELDIATSDIISDFNTSYYVMQSPTLYITDGGHVHISLGEHDNSHLMLTTANGTGADNVLIDDVVGTNNRRSLGILTDSKDYTGVSGLNVLMYSSTGVADITSQALKLSGDAEGFNNSDLRFIDIDLISAGSDNTVTGMNIEGSITHIINQGTTQVLDSAWYDNTTNIINMTNYFSSSTNDATLFEHQNSYIYIGNSHNFTRVGVSLTSGASHAIIPEYYYCNSTGNWNTLNGITDDTDGFTKTGSIIFINPSDRGMCNTEVDGTPFTDTTNYTYIAIKRTRNLLPTPPIENLISIGGGTTHFFLDEDVIKLVPVANPPYACSSAYQGAIYSDSTTVELLWCDGTSWQAFAETTDVTNHNALSGLQGGQVAEYYHLTASEYSGDWGSKNLTASYFLGDGSQLTNLPSGDNSSWNQSYADTLYATIDEPLWTANYTAYNSSWSSTYNSTYDAYNSTGLIKDWNSDGYIKDWNSSGLIINWSTDLSQYSTTSEILGFGYYNSTDFIITDYFTKSEVLGFNYYNSSDFDINDYFTKTQIEAFNYWNDTFATFNKSYADTLYSPINYGDDWNETYADTLYYGIDNSFGYYNSSDFNISDYYTSTETDTEITNVNTSMKSYVDAQDVIFNTSIKNYADGKFVVNSGGDSLSGQYDFNGGWTSNGLSIIDGDIYAQTGYFYNLTGLDVSTLKINGSILPQVGFDNQFDIGSSALRWKDLYLGGEVFSNGTGDNYFLGKVGVGVIPLSDFHVKSSAVNNLMTRFENSIGNIIGGFGETSLSDGVFTVRNSTGFVKASFHSNANSYILNNNFGIGTNAPSHKLHIKDTQDWIRLEEDGGTTNKKNYDIIGVDDEIRIRAKNDANSFVRDIITLEHDGNVGIGTTSPAAKLDIDGGAVHTFVRIQANDGYHAGMLGFQEGSQVFAMGYSDTTDTLNLVTGTNLDTINGIAIDTTGKVGIGTSSPSDKLEVAGNIVASNLNLKGATTESRSIEIGAERTGSGYAYIDFIGDTTYSDFGFRIIRNADGANANSEIKHRGTGDLVLNSVEGGDIVLTGGNVGIGTSSPSSPLDVIGEIESSGTHGGLIFGTGSILGGSNYGDVRILTDRFRVYDNAGSNVAMNIDSSGNVGIGTSSPEVKLDVNGSIKSTNLVSSTVSPDVRVYHDVAMYANDAASQVGSMVITLPKGWSNTMMQIEISGYDYTGITGAWKTVVGGYNYITSPAWISYYANSEGSTPFNNIRLGYDTATSRNVIILGTTATTWQFPQIAVTKVVTGYSSSDGWGTGWDINIRASETGLGNIVTPEVTMHGYNGNVGIGTTSPSGKLDVTHVAGTYGAAGIISQRTTTSDGVHYGLYNPTQKWDLVNIVSSTPDYFGIMDVTGSAMPFSIEGGASSSTLVVDSNSRVGIGIGNPNKKLEVTSAVAEEGIKLNSPNPSVWLTDTTDADKTWSIYNQGSGAGGLAFRSQNDALTATNTRMFIQHSNGNVGIGTDSPAAKLDLYQASNDNVYLHFGNTVTGATAADGVLMGLGTDEQFNIINYENTDIDIFTSGSQRMTIKNDGNVGIGPTSPAAKLDIYAKANNASNPGFKLDTLTRTITDTVFEITGSSGSNGVFIKNDGKVGIGITSPSAKLDVSGTSKFSDTMQWKHYYKSTSSPTEDTVFDALNSWVPNIGDFLACHGQAINNQTSSGITITGIFKRASSIIDIIYISYAGGSTRIIMNDGDATVVASTIEIMSNFDAIT